MLKRQTDEQLYFSTKVELKINNMRFRPSICYKVPVLAKKSLEKYAEGGKVTFYHQPVRFVNGAVVSSTTASVSEGVPSVVREEKPVRKRK